jgi:hypothetical protein
MLVGDSFTSSANGACGRQLRAAQVLSRFSSGAAMRTASSFLSLGFAMLHTVQRHRIPGQRTKGQMQERRRFPAPWSIEEGPSCFIARDSSGQALAYFYYEEEPGRRASAKLLTKDEARRLAANFAKLPDLLLGGAKA